MNLYIAHAEALKVSNALSVRKLCYLASILQKFLHKQVKADSEFGGVL